MQTKIWDEKDIHPYRLNPTALLLIHLSNRAAKIKTPKSHLKFSPNITTLPSLTELTSMEDISTSCRIQESSSEREKTHQIHEKEPNTDLFSNLPDELLIRILSLLKTKDAVKTGILSKRWRRLWTLVDNFVFEFGSFNFCEDEYEEEDDDDLNIEQKYDRLKKSIGFVDRTVRTLARCACPRIKKFSLSICFLDLIKPTDVACLIDRWVRVMYEKNVECVEINPNGCYYCPPEWFFKNSSILRLALCDCRLRAFELGWCVNWASLKSLFLKNVLMNDGEIAAVLSGCPALDTMELNAVRSFSRLDVMVPSLRRLVVSNFLRSKRDDALEIRAPWVKELVIEEVFCGVDCRLSDMNSLVYAELTFGEFGVDTSNLRWSRVLIKLLESVRHVEELVLGPLFIQSLSVMRLSGGLSPILKCKQLKVELPLVQRELPGMACILQGSPDLETLVIETVNSFTLCFQEYFNENSCSGQYLSSQPWNFQHLKNVKLVDSRDLCHLDDEGGNNEECYDLELSAYLLKNACVLEKLVITSGRDKYCKCPKRTVLKNGSLLSRKLLDICLESYLDAEWEFRRKCDDFIFSFSRSKFQQPKSS